MPYKQPDDRVDVDVELENWAFLFSFGYRNGQITGIYCELPRSLANAISDALNRENKLINHCIYQVLDIETSKTFYLLHFDGRMRIGSELHL